MTAVSNQNTNVYVTGVGIERVDVHVTESLLYMYHLHIYTFSLYVLLELGDTYINPYPGAYNYIINVCGAAGGPCAPYPEAFVCQIRKNPYNQFESVLAYSNTDQRRPGPYWNPSNSTYGGVTLWFYNGDSCNLRQRITMIDFQCDYTGTRNITIDENPECTFNVVYPTKYTCPGYAMSNLARDD